MSPLSTSGEKKGHSDVVAVCTYPCAASLTPLSISLSKKPDSGFQKDSHPSNPSISSGIILVLGIRLVEIRVLGRLQDRLSCSSLFYSVRPDGVVVAMLHGANIRLIRDLECHDMLHVHVTISPGSNVRCGPGGLEMT
jgi:hypothetical protein